MRRKMGFVCCAVVSSRRPQTSATSCCVCTTLVPPVCAPRSAYPPLLLRCLCASHCQPMCSPAWPPPSPPHTPSPPASSWAGFPVRPDRTNARRPVTPHVPADHSDGHSHSTRAIPANYREQPLPFVLSRAASLRSFLLLRRPDLDSARVPEPPCPCATAPLRHRGCLDVTHCLALRARARRRSGHLHPTRVGGRLAWLSPTDVTREERRAVLLISRGLLRILYNRPGECPNRLRSPIPIDPLSTSFAPPRRTFHSQPGHQIYARPTELRLRRLA